MRKVNLIIEDLDINSEYFICDFIERLGFSYTKQELKAPKQKKGKTISNIIDEIQSRYILSGYDVIQTFNIENGFFILVCHLKKGYRCGSSKCNPVDKYKEYVGYYLALARACGWEDLEKELLSKL